MLTFFKFEKKMFVLDFFKKLLAMCFCEGNMSVEDTRQTKNNPSLRSLCEN